MIKNKKILLAHGSGGRLTRELIENLVLPKFSNPSLDPLDDSAVINLGKKLNRKIAFTSDAFVVDPIFFPGGDIGKLSVCGTVNDIAMQGAVPLAISVTVILEEGIDLADIDRITDSIASAAKEAGVFIACGDTKVVERGKADKIFISTSGIGIFPKGKEIKSSGAVPGDDLIINGSIGDHGIAVMCARNDLKIKTELKSDCAPLNNLVASLISSGTNIHSMKDPTRGGVATALNEMADSSNIGIIIDEAKLPIRKEVRAACAILGLDPLYSANEGKFIAFVPQKHSRGAILKMQKHKYGKNSAIIGKAVKSPKGVWLKTLSGSMRPLVMLEGEQLPRIC